MEMKGIQNKLLEYIDKEHNTEENFQNINQLLIDQKILENRHDTSTFLYLISKIANNHHRVNDFFTKIEHVIKSIKDDILKHFTNTEIFDIFKQNKRLLLFLLQEKMIQFDTKIVSKIIEGKYRELFYPHYFYTEIKPFISCILDTDIKRKIPENFDQKRSNGENDQIVCELIRNDSIEEFITFVNKKFLPLSSLIDPSIFETNCFLLKNKKLNLIEHAAFFGSIQIFKYLHINGVELKPSIWIQAIHGNNPEVINYIQEKNVVPDDQSYEECLKEAVKCHHNDIVVYILDYLLDKKVETVNRHKKYNKNLLVYCFHYRNYISFPSRFQNNRFLFHYACEYDYFYIVKSLLNDKKMNLNGKIINNIFLIGLSFRIF